MSLGDDSKRLADLIDSVADGRSVDWDAAGTSPTDARMRRLHEMLRIVEGIAEVHRSEPASPDKETRSNLGTDDPTRGSTAASIATEGALGQWGHFLLLQKLGEGAFGEVYHARDTWLDHSVALKLLKPPLVDRKRFLHEARTLAQIRHPNVVAIHGADEHAGRLGFWMDFVDGHTLAEVVAREGVRSPAEAAVIGQDLCRAMAAVHATGIVHRDLKAQNVMRRAQTGHIILMDFGAGEAMDADRAGRRPTGTPLYLAPELFDGSVATRETDIYALGVLLFNVVTRSYPVHGESMGDLLRAHRRNERHHLGDMRPDLPDLFVRVVETMLAPDPAKRFHSATEARKALEEVVAPSVVVPAPPPVTWRHRVYVAVLTTLAMIVALIIIGFVSTGAFDVTFSRGSFDTSTPLDWFTVGRKVVLAPVVRIAILVFPLVLILTAARVCCRLVPSVGRRASWYGAACYEFLDRRELYDPGLILQLIAGLGALAFGALALYHWSDATVFATFVDTAPPEQLAALQPANDPHYDLFQRHLEYVLLAYGFVVYAVYTSVRRPGSRVSTAVRAYVIAVPAVAFLLMRALPWTVVYGNELPRVDYGAVRCYALGRQAEETLVFCPDDSPPRVHRHKDSELEDRGFQENVFTPRSQARVFAPTSP
jgi:hypothetical protein